MADRDIDQVADLAAGPPLVHDPNEPAYAFDGTARGPLKFTADDLFIHDLDNNTGPFGDDSTWWEDLAEPVYPGEADDLDELEVTD